MTLLAAIARVPFIGMAVVAPDSLDYLARAAYILEGKGFVNAVRTPGFPLLLAGFEAIGTDPAVAVVVLQNVVGILLPAAVLLAGRRFFNLSTGIVAGVVTATSPLLMLSEQFVLTDYLFGAVLFAATVLLVESVLRVSQDQHARWWLVATGAVFGLATLLRGNGQFAVVVIPVALILVLGVRRWRLVLRSTALSIGTMLILVAPWVIHNMVNYGTPLVTTLGPEALYQRVIDHDRIRPPADSPEGRQARLIYDKAYAYQAPDAELNTSALFVFALEHEGKDNVAATSVLQRISLDVIADDPSRYLNNTWNIFREFRTMYDPDHDPTGDNIARVRNDFQELGPEITIQGRTEAVPGDSQFTRGPWSLGQGLSRIIYVLTLGGLLTLALPFFGSRRSRAAATVLLTVVLIGLALSAATEHFEVRYGLPFTSLAWMLMAAASVAVIRLVIVATRAAAQSHSWNEVPKRLRVELRRHLSTQVMGSG